MAAVLLGGCVLTGPAPSEEERDTIAAKTVESASRLFQPLAPVADVHPLPTAPKEWIVALEGWGPGVLSAPTGAWTQRSEAELESLDARALDAGAAAPWVLSGIDRNSGAITFWMPPVGGAAGSWQEIERWTLDSALPDAHCLHREPETGHLAAFAFDARGAAHHRYVYDGTRKRPVSQPVRQFPGVWGAEDCAVDDRTQTLFVIEEDVGVWAYSTDPESDPSREAVALQAPFGTLDGDIVDLAVTGPGELFILTSDPNHLHHLYQGETLSVYALPLTMPLEGVAARRVGDRIDLVLVDDDEGLPHQLSLEVPLQDVAAAPRATPSILQARAQTAPMGRFGDAADDPALLLDPVRPERSRILGTDKREGLKVYGLDGREWQSLPVGRLNNVDVLPVRPGRSQVLIAASNRSDNSITLFTADEALQVTEIGRVQTDLNEVYGLCMSHDDHRDYVFINDTDGRIEQWAIRLDAEGQPQGERVRGFQLPSQPEGCVVDPATGQLYVGEEAVGVWRVSLTQPERQPEQVILIDDVLMADVEGMDVYRRGDRAYLVISSQGNDSFVVHALDDGYPRVAHFRVGVDLERGLDGASETDGLALSSAALPGYPEGLLVVQDGRNVMPEAPQNFKMVDWRDVQRLIDP